MPQPTITKVEKADAFEIVAVTPRIAVADALEAIEWYEKVFGAELLDRTDNPDGRVWHAVIAIGRARIIISDEFPETNTIAPTTVGAALGGLHLYVKDADRVAERAIAAGAEPAVSEEMAQPFELEHLDPRKPHDYWWGDRYILLEDPFGVRWEIAQPLAGPEQRKQGEDELFESASEKLTTENARQRADKWDEAHPKFKRPNVPPRESESAPRFRWE